MGCIYCAVWLVYIVRFGLWRFGLPLIAQCQHVNEQVHQPVDFVAARLCFVNLCAIILVFFCLGNVGKMPLMITFWHQRYN